MKGVLEMLGGRKAIFFSSEPILKNIFLTSLVAKTNTLKIPVTTSWAEMMALAWGLVEQQTLKCGLAPSPGIELGCSVPLEALVPFQTLAKSGTAVLAAEEGSY